MADEASFELPNHERQHKATLLFSQYVKSVTETFPKETAAAMLRDDVRILAFALGEHAGHLPAAEWLQVMAEKQLVLEEYERAARAAVPEPDPHPIVILPNVCIERGECNPSPHDRTNVVQFSERFRNSRKANT